MNQKKQGFTYVLVIIIVTISTSLITMMYYSSKESIQTTKLYTNYSSNYNMAVSGIEKLESELNFYLYQNIDNLLLKTNNYMQLQNLNKILFLEDNQFNFKMINTAHNVGEKNVYYKNILFIYFYSMFSTEYSNSFSYKIQNEIDEYLVTVNYILEGNEIKALSKAENLSNGTSTEVSAIISLEKGYEKANPTFKWGDVTTPFLYGVTCRSITVGVNSTFTGEIIEDDIVNFENYLNYGEDENILISSNIDINSLNDEYYIIFSKDDLTITNSGSKNFKGLIVSLKDINFIDCNTEITGNVIAKNNINISNSNINVIKDSDAIFKINYKNNKLYFSLLDSMKITNFRNVNEIVHTVNGIEEVLSNIQFNNIKSTEIQKLQFKTTDLIQK